MLIRGEIDLLNAIKKLGYDNIDSIDKVYELIIDLDAKSKMAKSRGRTILMKEKEFIDIYREDKDENGDIKSELIKSFTIVEPSSAKQDKYEKLIAEKGYSIAEKVSGFTDADTEIMNKLEEFKKRDRGSNPITNEEMELFKRKITNKIQELSNKSVIDDKKLAEFIMDEEIDQELWENDISPKMRKKIIESFESMCDQEKARKNLLELLPPMLMEKLNQLGLVGLGLTTPTD